MKGVCGEEPIIHIARAKDKEMLASLKGEGHSLGGALFSQL